MSDPELLDCEEVLRVMFAYVDGELSVTESAEVDAHLERCRSCFSRAEFERRLKARIADTADRSVRPEFERRIRTLIDDFAESEQDEHDRPTVQDA